MGPQYVRGIIEGNGQPPDTAMWVTYSVNKEDIWVSRVPIPLQSTVTTPVSENFDAAVVDSRVVHWVRRGNKVFLENVRYEMRAENGSGLDRGVESTQLNTVLIVFEAVAEGNEPFMVVGAMAGG